MASQAEENSQKSNKQDEIHAEVVEEPASAAEGGSRQPESGAGAAVPDDDPQALREALEAAQQAAEDNWNKLVRVQAEMDNLRKRTSRDVEHAHKYALDKFVSELLPVIDSLELGMNAADSAGSDDAASLREGMELTLKKLLDVMNKFGVVPVDPLGEKFNPERHEAVSMQESPDAESGSVITVVQKGYLLNDRLVRPAMVVVAK